MHDMWGECAECAVPTNCCATALVHAQQNDLGDSNNSRGIPLLDMIGEVRAMVRARLLRASFLNHNVELGRIEVVLT